MRQVLMEAAWVRHITTYTKRASDLLVLFIMLLIIHLCSARGTLSLLLLGRPQREFYRCLLKVSMNHLSPGLPHMPDDYDYLRACRSIRLIPLCDASSLLGNLGSGAECLISTCVPEDSKLKVLVENALTIADRQILTENYSFRTDIL